MNTQGATIYPTRAKQVTNLIGCEHLELVRGEGYWYFIYDDQRGKYETQSVSVMRLNHLSLVEWVKEGKQLVTQMEPKPVEEPLYPINRQQVERLIGNKHVSVIPRDGFYLQIIYDDKNGNVGVSPVTHLYLRHLPLADWVAAGKELVKKMEGE